MELPAQRQDVSAPITGNLAAKCKAIPGNRLACEANIPATQRGRRRPQFFWRYALLNERVTGLEPATTGSTVRTQTAKNPVILHIPALCLSGACQTLHPADIPRDVLLMHLMHANLAADERFREVLHCWNELLPIDQERILATARVAALRTAVSVWESEGGSAGGKAAG